MLVVRARGIYPRSIDTQVVLLVYWRCSQGFWGFSSQQACCYSFRGPIPGIEQATVSTSALEPCEFSSIFVAQHRNKHVVPHARLGGACTSFRLPRDGRGGAAKTSGSARCRSPVKIPGLSTFPIRIGNGTPLQRQRAKTPTKDNHTINAFSQLLPMPTASLTYNRKGGAQRRCPF